MSHSGERFSAGHYRIEPKHRRFLVPCRVLSVVFRGLVKRGLKRAGLLSKIAMRMWRKPWVVHAQHAGRGDKALDYLARYVLRIAITNNRLARFEHGQVTFRYRDNRTQQLQRCILPRSEFLRRFLFHVLPARFTKVRAYGLSSSRATGLRDKVRGLISNGAEATPPTPMPQDREDQSATRTPAPALTDFEDRCPSCKQRTLRVVMIIACWRGPPAWSIARASVSRNMPRASLLVATQWQRFGPLTRNRVLCGTKPDADQRPRGDINARSIADQHSAPVDRFRNPTGAVPSRLKTQSIHADDDHGLSSSRLFIAAARDKKP